MASVALRLGDEVSYWWWAFGLDDEGIADVGGVFALWQNGRLRLRWLGGDLASLCGAFDASSLNMPGLYFLRHSNDANWPLLWLNLNSFIQTHDRLLQYMEKGRFPRGNSRASPVSNDWKHVPSFETEFRSEEDLTGVAPIVGAWWLPHWHVAIYLLM